MNVLIACEESQEIWKDIPGYEGKYQASTLGRIRSVDRIITRVDGKKIHIKAKILSSNIKDGYPHVHLEGGKTFKVHYLIALTFLGKRPEKYEVRHKDDNKTNNRLDNLEYGTRSENNLDRYKNCGCVCRSQKLNPSIANEIREMLQNGISQRSLAKKYGVSKSTIAAIKNGKLYKTNVEVIK